MCGGRGTRLGGATEKPLTPIHGRPMIDRVLDALAASRVATVHAVVSPQAPETRAHLADRVRLAGRARLAERAADHPALRLVDAPGDGYVADLRYAAESIESSEAAGPDGVPALTVAADLPLLDGEAVNVVLDAARDAEVDSLTVCVPTARKRELGVSADAATEIDGTALVPAGINVVGGIGGSSEDRDRDENSAESDKNDDSDAGDASAIYRTTDRRLAVNVNYPSDVEIAERLLAEDDGSDESGDEVSNP
ncbi:NTP transferase domain-containing protein [Halorubrum sp. DTA46]|uniref:NTP transferase domain-containing protein n=1 Tax=Halorubrum sp. DTA46 TaxID=3402162 RepID=UPI003AB0A03C